MILGMIRQFAEQWKQQILVKLQHHHRATIRFRAATLTSSEVMEWCKSQFEDDAAVKHWLRIERRLGRSPMMLSGPFALSDATSQLRHEPKMYLGSIFFKRMKH